MTKFFVFQTVYVMPSSSARCSQLPRAVDKVPFYASLKKLRDYLRGDLKEL
jgi:TDG/mug DNA glycosylase family protein